MNAETYKREAAAGALDFVKPGMRLGLGTGSTARPFVELLGERVRAGLDIIAVPTSEATRDAGGAVRHPAHHARRDAGARSDHRRRRRDFTRPHADQGRRRRAAAREDRRGGLGAHGGDRGRVEMGRDAWPVCAADRGRAVRPRGDETRRRSRDRCRRLSRPAVAAPGQGRPYFRHGRRPFHPRCGAAKDRRSARAGRAAGWPFRESSNTGFSSGSPMWP